MGITDGGVDWIGEIDGKCFICLHGGIANDGDKDGGSGSSRGNGDGACCGSEVGASGGSAIGGAVGGGNGFIPIRLRQCDGECEVLGATIALGDGGIRDSQ